MAVSSPGTVFFSHTFREWQGKSNNFTKPFRDFVAYRSISLVASYL